MPTPLSSRECFIACLQGTWLFAPFIKGRPIKVHLQVAENTSLGQAVSVRPLRLYTDKGTYPQFPSSVLVDYESGGVKRVKVVWEEIPKEALEKFHEFTVSGQLEGLDLKASAQVCVQGICAIEPEKVWTLVKESPHLPERVKLVLSDGRRDTAKVTWDELDPQIYAQVGEYVLTGQVAGCELLAKVTIHVTGASVDGGSYFQSVDRVQFASGLCFSFRA